MTSTVRNLAIISAVTVFTTVCMFLPYLPGDYDGFAVTLSTMVQLFGMAGLLLVPIGMAWLVFELKRRPPAAGAQAGNDLGYGFGLTAVGASTLVAIVVAAGAFSNAGRSAGLVVIALWAGCAWRLVGKLKAMRKNPTIRSFNWAPVYLIVLPLVVVSFRIALLSSAVEFSRSRAISNSAPLIRDIERYREANGRYPLSLLAVWPDYKPAIIGVKQYHYELNGDGYNVYFEHAAHSLATREFVMLNKLNQHEMTSHAEDLLLLTPAALAAQRGYYAVHATSVPHWKYFWFD